METSHMSIFLVLIASSFKGTMCTSSVYCTYKLASGLFELTECEEACCSGVANSERNACCPKHDMPWEFILMIIFIVIAALLMVLLMVLMKKYHNTLKLSNMYKRMLDRSKPCSHTCDGVNPPPYAALPPSYDVVDSELTEEDQCPSQCDRCAQAELASTSV